MDSGKRILKVSGIQIFFFQTYSIWGAEDEPPIVLKIWPGRDMGKVSGMTDRMSKGQEAQGKYCFLISNMMHTQLALLPANPKACVCSTKERRHWVSLKGGRAGNITIVISHSTWLWELFI